jgi:3-carboxy-cis,cis-muconate cycloisomerase
MTATVIDSIILCHLFSSEPMRQVFSDENRVQCYLDIEAAVARVQARLGLNPQRAANEITAKCTLDIIDIAKLKSES